MYKLIIFLLIGRMASVDRMPVFRLCRMVLVGRTSVPFLCRMAFRERTSAFFEAYLLLSLFPTAPPG